MAWQTVGAPPRRRAFDVDPIDMLRPGHVRSWPGGLSIEQAFEAMAAIAALAHLPGYREAQRWGWCGPFEHLAGTGTLGHGGVDPVRSVAGLRAMFHNLYLGRPNCAATERWMAECGIALGTPIRVPAGTYREWCSVGRLGLSSEDEVRQLLDRLLGGEVGTRMAVSLNGCHSDCRTLRGVEVRMTAEGRFAFVLRYGDKHPDEGGSEWAETIARSRRGESFLDTLARARDVHDLLVHGRRFECESIADSFDAVLGGGPWPWWIAMQVAGTLDGTWTNEEWRPGWPGFAALRAPPTAPGEPASPGGVGPSEPTTATRGWCGMGGGDGAPPGPASLEACLREAGVDAAWTNWAGGEGTWSGGVVDPGMPGFAWRMRAGRVGREGLAGLACDARLMCLRSNDPVVGDEVAERFAAAAGRLGVVVSRPARDVLHAAFSDVSAEVVVVDKGGSRAAVLRPVRVVGATPWVAGTVAIERFRRDDEGDEGATRASLRSIALRDGAAGLARVRALAADVATVMSVGDVARWGLKPYDEPWLCMLAGRGRGPQPTFVLTTRDPREVWAGRRLPSGPEALALERVAAWFGPDWVAGPTGFSEKTRGPEPCLAIPLASRPSATLRAATRQASVGARRRIAAFLVEVGEDASAWDATPMGEG